MARRSKGPDWLPLAGAALAAWFVLRAQGSGLRAQGSGSLPPGSNPPIYGPTAVPLVGGNSYLFIIRLSAMEDAARALLQSKGATMIEFAPASVPPPWATDDEPWSQEVVSFKATPQGSSTVLIGDDFYGIGRIERVIGL